MFTKLTDPKQIPLIRFAHPWLKPWATGASGFWQRAQTPAKRLKFTF